MLVVNSNFVSKTFTNIVHHLLKKKNEHKFIMKKKVTMISLTLKRKRDKKLKRALKLKNNKK